MHRSKDFGTAAAKVIIDTSRGEVSLMEQDTIENVSEHMKKLEHNFQNYHVVFNTSKFDANYGISFEVYDGFLGQKI